MSKQDLLLEIGCEELPPGALAGLAAALAANIHTALGGELPAESREYFYSPRRLAVKFAGIPARQPDQVQRRLGPAVQAAFDKFGKPTKAAAGFAASCGVGVEQLEREQTGKGERLAYTVTSKGRPTADRLPDIVREAIRKLPIPKRMRWGAGDTEFVRPVHWIVMLLGKTVVEGEILGVKSGRQTYGHRFHAPGALKLKSADEYPQLLEIKGRVRVNDRNNRLAQAIMAMVKAEADKLGGVAVGIETDDLASEVAALNEWPVPVVGGFDEKYLALPEEVLITTLEHHQRYFPVRGRGKAGKPGKLLPHFITFANIESKNPDVVRRGNERVVVPRLEDAIFFWNQDRKTKLAQRRAQLDGVTFQKDLGSYGAKVERVIKLAADIARQIGSNAKSVERAAQLAKCDLLSDMVGEFPELQGVMGEYYARHDGEDAEVAQAIREHYLPRFAGDALPATQTGRALAIADKLDTVSGIFAIGQKPTGDKDPFALRRAALGVLRIIIESALELDLRELVATASALHAGKQSAALEAEVFAFFMERLRAYYLEAGIRADVFEAVLAKSPAQPLDFDQRVQAVNGFLALPEAAALAAANKRIGNILRQARLDIDAPGEPDAALFTEAAERELHAAITRLAREVKPQLAQRDYAAALKRLASLRAPVDAFFDKVMVMVEDAKIRSNRLALLASLGRLFLHTADLSQIQIER